MNLLKLIFPVLKWRRLVFLLLLLSVIAFSSNAAQIKTSIDRNPVGQDESFQITFSTTETPDDNPDFSPLEQDFSILGQTSGSNFSSVNGKTTHSLQWTLTVMAKQPGKVIIPAISFGADSSQPLPIEVVADKMNQTSDSNADMFIEAEATPKDPYLQAQVIYTLRLFRRVDLAQAQLTDPDLADAVIEKLGEDSNYSTQIRGVDYSVTERKYAIFPQKSGEAVIKPVVLTAEVLTGQRVGWFNQQTTQTKRVQSKEIKLNVKPQAGSFSGSHWLAAEQLNIKQEWSGDFEQMKVGEPLTRTLKVEAKGTTVGQLLEMNTLSNNDRFKVYPDQPILKEQKTTDGLISSREEKIAIIPSKAGSFTLPAIEVPWFNTQTQKSEIALIPAVTLKAGGSANVEPSVFPAAGTASVQPAVSVASAQSAMPAYSSYWPWISAFLGFGWLATIIYLLMQKRSPSEPVPTISSHSAESEQNLKMAVNRLKKACSDNNLSATKEALLVWGRLQFNETSLAMISHHCNEPLRQEILTVNQLYYGQPPKHWQGHALWEAFQTHKITKTKTVNDEGGLEPLYRL